MDDLHKFIIADHAFIAVQFVYAVCGNSVFCQSPVKLLKTAAGFAAIVKFINNIMHQKVLNSAGNKIGGDLPASCRIIQFYSVFGNRNRPGIDIYAWQILRQAVFRQIPQFISYGVAFDHNKAIGFAQMFLQFAV